MIKLLVFLASLLTQIALVVTAFSPPARTRRVPQYPVKSQANVVRYRRHHHLSTCILAIPIFNWFQRKDDAQEAIDVSKLTSRGQPDDDELMHRTVEMMENHRRSQEAAERTTTIMDELSNTVVTGKSKAGIGAIGLGGSGVKVNFDGTSRPISVEVDPKFLFSSSESGVISIEELNAALTEAMLDGYEQSGKLMEEKMKALYEQLGLPKEGGT